MNPPHCSHVKLEWSSLFSLQVDEALTGGEGAYKQESLLVMCAHLPKLETPCKKEDRCKNVLIKNSFDMFI